MNLEKLLLRDKPTPMPSYTKQATKEDKIHNGTQENITIHF